MAAVAKGQRITGSDRTKLARELKKQYLAGRSIRELAEEHARSYGFVHRILSDTNTSCAAAAARPARAPPQDVGQEDRRQEGTREEGVDQEGAGEEDRREEGADQEGRREKAPAKKTAAKKTAKKK